MDNTPPEANDSLGAQKADNAFFANPERNIVYDPLMSQRRVVNSRIDHVAIDAMSEGLTEDALAVSPREMESLQEYDPSEDEVPIPVLYGSEDQSMLFA